MPEAARWWRSGVADTLVYAALFGAGNLVSYLYIVVAGRQLDGADFGVFNALLGLLTLAGIAAAAVQAAVAQAVTPEAGRRARLALLGRVAGSSAVLVVLAGVAALPFAAAIGADGPQVGLLALAVWTSVLAAVAVGFVIARGRIRASAAIGLAGALARLGSGWPLLLLGFGIGGALAGYVVNYLVVLVIAGLLGLRACARTVSGSERLRLDATSMATFVLGFAPFCLDQFLVQLFNPGLGGDYAAAATIARLIFFVSYPLTAVAYARMLASPDAGTRTRTLAAAMTAMVLGAVLLAVLLAAFPDLLLELFFAGRFAAALPQVGLLAFAIACFSLSALAAHALIVWRCRSGFAASALAFAVGVLLFASRHDSLATVVANQVWVCVLQAVLVCAHLAWVLRRTAAATA